LTTNTERICDTEIGSDTKPLQRGAKRAEVYTYAYMIAYINVRTHVYIYIYIDVNGNDANGSGVYRTLHYSYAAQHKAYQNTTYAEEICQCMITHALAMGSGFYSHCKYGVYMKCML